MAGLENVGGVRAEAEIDTTKFDASTKKLAGTVEQLNAPLKRTEQNLRNVEKTSDIAGKKVSNLALSFGRLTAALSLSQIATNGILRGLNLLSRGAGFLFKEPLKQAIAFEQMMAKISTVVEDSSQESMRKLGDEVLEMTKKFPKSKEELGMGLYAILQAGVEDSAEAMKLLDLSTRAAIGGVTEVGVASKLATDIMGAYNLTSEEMVGVMDSVFVGAQKGKAEFVDLAGSLGRVMGAAASLNVEIPEVVAGVETMANAGFSAEMAATSLNSFLNSVLKASKGTGEAAKVAKSLGIEYNAVALKSMGLPKFIDEVTKKAGNNEVVLQALTQDVRAFRAVAAIGGKGAEFFTETLAAMEDGAGALDEAFQKMNGTIQNQLLIAWNRFDAAITKAGRENTPELREEVNALNKALDENEESIAEAAAALSQTLIAGMAAAVEAAPALIGALNAIAKAAGNAVSAIGLVMKSLKESNFRTLHSQGLISDEQFNLSLMELEGVKTPAQRQLELTMQQMNEKFGAGKDITEDDVRLRKQLEEELENQVGLPGGGGGGEDKTREKLLKDIEKIEKGILQALGEQAKENKDRMEHLREELKLKEEMGILTDAERKQLDRINNRIEFQDDKIKDATKAWKDQKKIVEDVRKEIQKITEDIEDQERQLQETLSGIDRDLERRKAEIRREAGRSGEQGIADLLKEQADLEGNLARSEGLSIEEQQRLEELRGILMTAKVERPDLFTEGQKIAGMNELELLDRETSQKIGDVEAEAEQAKKDAVLEHNVELEESVIKLAEANTRLLLAEEALIDKKDDVIQAVDEMRTKNEANYSIIEENTRIHVQNEIAEFEKLRQKLSQVERAYAGAGGVPATTNPAQGFASGGPVVGPGTGTSDSIVARLSHGEHVLTAAEVRAMGGQGSVLQFRNMLREVPRFAEGGPVTQNNQRTATITVNNHGRAAEIYADPRRARWHARTYL